MLGAAPGKALAKVLLEVLALVLALVSVLVVRRAQTRATVPALGCHAPPVELSLYRVFVFQL